MSDLADFEHIMALEQRLSTALDRIAAGLAADTGLDDTGNDAAVAEAEAARDDAETRASEAVERVSALEARLAETQDTLAEAQSDLSSAREQTEAARAEAETARVHAAQTPAADPVALAALEQQVATAEAARAQAETELATRAEELVEKDAALAEMHAALEAAQAALEAMPTAEAPAHEVPGNQPEAETEDMEKALAVMGRRVERARMERDQARTACDAATDALDELKEATGASVDTRILTLRGQLRLMRGRAEDLAAQVSLLQSGADVDAELLDQGLLAEVETLRQLRDTDAAELDRIVQDMQAGLDETEGTHDA